MAGERPLGSSGLAGKAFRVRLPWPEPWWEGYTDADFCIFGHYGAPPGQPHGHGRAICIDYAVAKRWRERLYPEFRGTFKGRLAAIRFPEKVVVFDDGTMIRAGD
jgi:hypothetical protein